MTLIRNDITGKTENLTNNDIDWQKTTIWTKSRTKFTIHNMYCPPGTNSGLPLINEAKTKTIIARDFNEHLPGLGYERYNNNREGHKTWRLLNNLEGKSIKTNPQPLIQNGKEIVCDKRKAEEFNKYFANVNKQERRDTLDSHLWRAAKKNNSAPGHKHVAFETPFNLAELNTALKRLKNNKVPGSNNIKNELLKNLGGKGKLVLLALINRTWREKYLPSSWRTAIICPILKKGISHRDYHRATN